MSARRLGVRLSIGFLLVVGIVVITAYDARGGRFRIGSLVAAALGAIALVEYTKIAGLVGRSAGRGALVAGIVVLFWRSVEQVVGFPAPPHGFLYVQFGIGCAVTIFAAVAARRSTPVVPEDLRDLALAILGLLIVVFPVLSLIEIGSLEPGAGFSPRSCTFFSADPVTISENGVGPWLLLVTILVSKLNDIGGYLVGSLVGRTPLAPGISPKKSLEGAAAGLVLGVGCSIAAFFWFCPLAGLLTLAQAIGFGLLISVATQLGDLCESLVKRASGVKDSAVLIPAFGGIFDLLDSFILAAPAGYTLLWVWVT